MPESQPLSPPRSVSSKLLISSLIASRELQVWAPKFPTRLATALALETLGDRFRLAVGERPRSIRLSRTEQCLLYKKTNLSQAATMN